jgi:hypothetical protein
MGGASLKHNHDQPTVRVHVPLVPWRVKEYPPSTVNHQQSAISNMQQSASANQQSATSNFQNERFRPQNNNASVSNFIPKTAFGILNIFEMR